MDSAPEPLADDDDPYLWLEEPTSVEALEWVRARNAESAAVLAATPRFGQLREEIREVLDSTDRIPFPRWRGEFLYNFWQDEEHPRGVWRRTTMASYRQASPQWEVLIDVDALAEAEDENWVWQGATSLRPEHRRYLILLSRGGSDACVVREYDLDAGAFVADGFNLAEAKSDVAWIDIDHVFVGTDFGPGSLTESGYPRLARRWRRGTPLEQAETVFEGSVEDVSVYASHDQTPGFARDFVGRSMDYYRAEHYVLRPGDERVRIEVPEDAVIEAQREWLLIQLRTGWSVDGVSYAAGALLVTDFEDFLAGGRRLTVLFEPDEHTALSYYMWTRNHLILVLLQDVHSRLLVGTPGPGGWSVEALAGVPELSQTDVTDTEPDSTDEYLLNSSGFLEPRTLRLGAVGGAVEVLKHEPAFFDPGTATVRQFFATSVDGTRVPYFVVGDPDARDAPTLLSGYGGFEVSQTPHYGAITGRAWLARGGVFVVANIRGGGEYGPTWHRAAIRENRPRAFEDFASVAVDLVDRGITTPARLGVEGGSNGGLLMGVMLTRYPEHVGAIVCYVPLLDMRRYHLLLAGASWMAEYGDPDDPYDWAFLRQYSPYQNVRSGQKYPPTLFITSTRDDRVHPAHARKMVARLRELDYDVTYYENIEGGHGAAANNEQVAYQQALVHEFLWQRLAP
jgi:prolyl oligopeptidase